MSSDDEGWSVNTFFEGVDEVRSFLDRHIQDPAHRRARLATIAQGLLRPRDGRELAGWLTAQLSEALGVAAVAVYLRRAQWQLWALSGDPATAGAAALEDLDALEDGPRVTEAGTMVPCAGIDGVVAAIVLAGETELDPASSQLLQAIADTAGVVMEQGLKVELLGRDPTTGLRSESGFLEAAGAALRAGEPRALVALRAVAEGSSSSGLLAVEAARQLLCDVVRDCAPRGAILGTRLDDVVALLPATGDPETTIRALIRDVDRGVRAGDVGAGGTLSATAAFAIGGYDVTRLGPLLDRLIVALGHGPPGRARPLPKS